MKRWAGQKGLGLLLWVVSLFAALAGPGASFLLAEGTDIPVYAGFTALSEGNGVIMVIGDTQRRSLLEFWREDNKKQTRVLLEEIARQKAGMAIHLGDMVFSGADAGHWRELDEGLKKVREAGIPVFPILGNHEYWSQPKRAMAHIAARFPHLGGRKWYGFIFRRTGFIMTDSNFSRLTAAENGEQQKWYREELRRMEQSGEVDFIVVCAHHPPFTNSRTVKPDIKVRERLAAPFLRATKGGIFFSGHCHAYERFEMGGKYFIVSGGGGGPRQRVETDERRRRYADRFQGPGIRFLHMCRMEVEGERLRVRVIAMKESGGLATADEFEIRKR